MDTFLEFVRSDVIDRRHLSDERGHHVFLVNGEKVRGLSRTLEEFTDYAIHDDFPRDIPESEVWVDSAMAAERRRLLVEEALNRAKYLAAGFSSKDAYDKALARSKAHLEKLSGRKTARKHGKVPSGIRLRKYKDLPGGMTAWIVDTDLVRKTFKTDFVEGGNGYAYPWQPKDEVWIADDARPDEREFILDHETHELADMRDRGMGYQEAHERASTHEYNLRRTMAMAKKNAGKKIRAGEVRKQELQEKREAESWDNRQFSSRIKVAR